MNNKSFIPLRKKHYQAITNAYTDLYDHQSKLSQNNGNVYYFDSPWKFYFELTTGTPKTVLDGFLSLLPSSTCESEPAQDPLEQYLPH